MNPIKVPVDSSELKALIAELQKLQKQMESSKESIVNDSKALEKSIQGVTTATAAEREQLEQAAIQAEQLAKEKAKLNESIKKNKGEILRLKEEQKKANKIEQLNIKLQKAKKDSFDEIEAQYKLNLIQLKALTKEERKNSDEGKRLSKQNRELRERMEEFKDETGRATLQVKNQSKSFGGLRGALLKVNDGFKAFIANPVVLTLAAITALFAGLKNAMSRSEEGQDRLNKIWTVAGSVLDNVLDVLGLIGIALFDAIPAAVKKAGVRISTFVKTAQRGFKNAQLAVAEFLGQTEKTDRLKKEIQNIDQELKQLTDKGKELDEKIGSAFEAVTDKAKNFRKEVNEDIKAASKLADLQSKLNRAERKNIVENAKLSKQAAALRAQAEEVKKSAADASLQALQKVFDLEEKAAANEVKLAKIRFNVLKETSALASDDIEAKKEIANANAAIIQAETALENKRRERFKQLNTFRLEAFKQENDRQKASLEILKLRNEIEIDGNKKIIDSSNELRSVRENALKNISSIQRNEAQKAFEIQKATLDKELELRLKSQNDYAVELELLQTRLSNELNKIRSEETKGIDKINADELKKVNKQNVEKLKLEKAFQDFKKNIQTAAEDGNQRVFEQRQAFAKSEFDLLKTTEEQKKAFSLKQEKERLQQILDFNKRFGKEISQVQIDTVKNQIQRIDNELSELARDGGFTDIYDLFGFKLNDAQKSGITESIGFVKGALVDLANTRAQVAQQNIDQANADIAAAQRALEVEINNRNAGLANKVESRQKDLADAKKRQEEALREQQKAAKAQQRIQTIEQSVNLITASSKIWKSFSGFGPVGIGLAVAAIATMFGSFIASKAKAAKLTKKQFATGGMEIIGGGSHASGRDTYLGFESEGKPAYAERGEAHIIVPRKYTKKYKNELPGLVETLRNGTFEANYKKANADHTGDNYNYVIGGAGSSSTDTSRMENELGAIRQQGERKFYNDSNGNTVEYYKNLKRVYVKS